MGLIPGAALALMPLPLVIQDRVQARKLTSRPSRRIHVRASRPCLNKIPFQSVQLFANHKLTPTLITILIARRKQTSVLPDFGSCFVKRAKRTARGPEPLSLRRYRRRPETIPALGARPPSRLLQCVPVLRSLQSQRVQLGTASVAQGTIAKVGTSKRRWRDA